MANANNANTPPDRPRPQGRPLSDEISDDLPALLIIAVGIAVIVAVVTPLGVPVFASNTADDSHQDDTAQAAAEDEEEHDEEPEEEPETVELDLAAMVAGLEAEGLPGIELSADGGVVTAQGTVADDAARQAVLGFLAAQPGVESVIDELTIAPAANGAVTIAASQGGIVLTGEVPEQAVADELVNRASEMYSADQIDNQLVVNDGLEPPTTITVTGTVTDGVLHGLLSERFGGIDGVDSVNTSGLTLEESSDLETALNSLEPVQFSSGSAAILGDSAAILDEAAEFLTASPDVSIEIGGHTDSTGDEQLNQQLSQARAEAVQAALTERGVTNEMVARGFGESRLKVDPDDTPDKQQENRRIEFRIVG